MAVAKIEYTHAAISRLSLPLGELPPPKKGRPRAARKIAGISPNGRNTKKKESTRKHLVDENCQDVLFLWIVVLSIYFKETAFFCQSKSRFDNFWCCGVGGGPKIGFIYSKRSRDTIAPQFCPSVWVAKLLWMGLCMGAFRAVGLPGLLPHSCEFAAGSGGKHLFKVWQQLWI